MSTEVSAEKPVVPTAPQTTNRDIEAAEEAKLKAKYPQLGGMGMGRKGVGSSVLQKRINRGQKYFDSGDYNMARSKIAHPGMKKPVPPVQEQMQLLHESTGETIPTPENVPAVRKRSMAANAPEGLGHGVPLQPAHVMRLRSQEEHS